MLFIIYYSYRIFMDRNRIKQKLLQAFDPCLTFENNFTILKDPPSTTTSTNTQVLKISKHSYISIDEISFNQSEFEDSIRQKSSKRSKSDSKRKYIKIVSNPHKKISELTQSNIKLPSARKQKISLKQSKVQKNDKNDNYQDLQQPNIRKNEIVVKERVIPIFMNQALPTKKNSMQKQGYQHPKNLIKAGQKLIFEQTNLIPQTSNQVNTRVNYFERVSPRICSNMYRYQSPNKESLVCQKVIYSTPVNELLTKPATVRSFNDSPNNYHYKLSQKQSNNKELSLKNKLMCTFHPHLHKSIQSIRQPNKTISLVSQQPNMIALSVPAFRTISICQLPRQNAQIENRDQTQLINLSSCAPIKKITNSHQHVIYKLPVDNPQTLGQNRSKKLDLISNVLSQTSLNTPAMVGPNPTEKSINKNYIQQLAVMEQQKRMLQSRISHKLDQLSQKANTMVRFYSTEIRTNRKLSLTQSSPIKSEIRKHQRSSSIILDKSGKLDNSLDVCSNYLGEKNSTQTEIQAKKSKMQYSGITGNESKRLSAMSHKGKKQNSKESVYLKKMKPNKMEVITVNNLKTQILNKILA